MSVWAFGTIAFSLLLKALAAISGLMNGQLALRIESDPVGVIAFKSRSSRFDLLTKNLINRQIRIVSR